MMSRRQKLHDARGLVAARERLFFEAERAYQADRSPEHFARYRAALNALRRARRTLEAAELRVLRPRSRRANNSDDKITCPRSLRRSVTPGAQAR